MGAMSRLGHQPFEHGGAGQQDLAFDEPLGGPIKEHDRPLIPDPRPRQQPARQCEVVRLVVELVVAIRLSNLTRMALLSVSVGVSPQARQ